MPKNPHFYQNPNLALHDSFWKCQIIAHSLSGDTLNYFIHIDSWGQTQSAFHIVTAQQFRYFESISVNKIRSSYSLKLYLRIINNNSRSVFKTVLVSSCKSRNTVNLETFSRWIVSQSKTFSLSNKYIVSILTFSDDSQVRINIHPFENQMLFGEKSS